MRRPALMRSGPFTEVPTPPNQLRWDPVPIPEAADGFCRRHGDDGRQRRPGDADRRRRSIFMRRTASMEDRFFYNADGELLIVPQQGALRFATELGVLEVAPGEICVIPRGHQVPRRAAGQAARAATSARTTAQPFRLPELGPIGANGLANPRDFLTPVAAFEDLRGRLPDRREIPGQAVVARRSITRRWTWWRGTGTTRRTSTTWRSSTASTR